MTIPQKHWALAWRWYKETLGLLVSVLWQYATTNVHTDSWNTVTTASRMGLCTTDSKCLKQNVINKRRKNKRGKIQLASNPFPELWYPRYVILIVCRVPMNTYTQHLKSGCIKNTNKKMFEQLILHPSANNATCSSFTFLGSLWYYHLRRGKKHSTLQEDSFLNQHTNSNPSSSTYPLFS